MAWSRNLERNADPIETAELEDLIGQTSQCMHSGKEHHESQGDHAHELAEVHRWTVDETHDLTIECHASGGCKGCVGVPRGSASGGVLRYSHIHTPLDDSTRSLDDSTNSTVHNPQRAGALVTSIILDGATRVGPGQYPQYTRAPKVGGGCG